MNILQVMNQLEQSYKSVTTVAFNHAKGNEAFIIKLLVGDVVKARQIDKRTIRIYDCFDLDDTYKGTLFMNIGGHSVFVNLELEQLICSDLAFI